MRFLMVLVLASVLTACGQTTSTPSQATQTATDGYAVANRDVATEESVAADAPAPPPPAAGARSDDQRPQSTIPGAVAPATFLAYSYQMGLEIPSTRLASVMDAHVRACQTAGPRLCQLVGSNRAGDPDSAMSGTVNIRGEPNWLRTFMGGVSAQVNAAGGRVLSQATNTEDLTRSIVDTQAHLRAQTELRDRLEQLLRSRPGRLSDLLDVERELARVQSEIDATQSNLAVMRTRVDMSELAINYQSSPRPVGSDTFDPLRQAIANFLGVVVVGFAAIITIIAGLLPFAIVLIPIVWGVLTWRRRRGGRLFGPRPPAPPAES